MSSQIRTRRAWRVNSNRTTTRWSWSSSRRTWDWHHDHRTTSGVAERELVIPSLPHSIRMLLETALANEGRKARVALEIESVPAILDLVQQGEAHAVLSLNAIQSSGQADAFFVQPIHKPKMTTTLWIATSSQRHRGPLIDQSTELVKELLLKLWS